MGVKYDILSLRMGHGASILGKEKKSVVANNKLRAPLSKKSLVTELDITRQKLRDKEIEISQLKSEIHKLKSILEAVKIHKDGKPLGIVSLETHKESVADNVSIASKIKKRAVFGETTPHSDENTFIKYFEKDSRSKQLIKNAVQKNDLLRNLTSEQIHEICECMYEEEVLKDHFVIEEGEMGNHFYVSAEGTFQVSAKGEPLGIIENGVAFGELAVLYDCIRTASIKALETSRIWVLERSIYQAIMRKTGLDWLKKKVNFLKSVSLLQNLDEEYLTKIADVLELDYFHEEEYIIREGAIGNSFFIINKGSVRVTQSVKGSALAKEVRILKKGDYFGEKALLSEDMRTANVIAMSPGVECLTLERDDFIQLIGSLVEITDKKYTIAGIQEKEKRKISIIPFEYKNVQPNAEYDDISIKDLSVLATLGLGSFGRVELVQLYSDRQKTFALKCLKKQHIVATHQQEHVYYEKNIMMAMNSPFITKMYKTFKDNKYVYMLMEVCLGGELWSLLRNRSNFDDVMTRFCVCCVLEAFEYLHAREIVYRDLKPENLLLSTAGYVKLVDFGFAKKVPRGKKTWTFCGTPEYVPPEIILNKGHDSAVDYWAVGILIYELSTGGLPFTAKDPMKLYNLILKGIDALDFPSQVSRNAGALIKKLCRDNPSERLGYGRNGIKDIKTQKWFQGFDWIGLQKQTLIPPIVPTVTGPADYSNFDHYNKYTEVPPDETSGWDKNF